MGQSQVDNYHTVRFISAEGWQNQTGMRVVIHITRQYRDQGVLHTLLVYSLAEVIH